MSVVTGIILTCSLDDDEEGDAPQLLNAWLTSHGYDAALTDVTDAFGGRKHPQFCTLGGAINYFLDDEDFISFVLHFPWRDPEEVALIIRPEDGPITVYRPATN